MRNDIFLHLYPLMVKLTTMKLSIITATYNSAAHIAPCITSVNEQTYSHLEHIIVDGASSDNTLEIIKAVSKREIRIVSEPDRGIYDALNKGIQRATGDVIGFLHADDTFGGPDTLTEIAKAFSSQPNGNILSGVYGNLVFTSQDNPGKIIRKWQSRPFRPSRINLGWMPPHPTLFLRKEVYQQIGLFKTDYRIAGDYELMLRLMKHPETNLCWLNQTITRMTMGGASTGNLKNLKKKSQEDLRALRSNGFEFPYLVLACKIGRKLPQLLKR